MRPVRFISGVIVAAALQAGMTGIAVAESVQSYEANGGQGYHALAKLVLSGRQASSILQMSDMQLAAVVGGQMATPSQAVDLSNDLLSGKMSQTLNQLLSRQANQSGSTTTQSSMQIIESGNGRVTAEQVQTSTQSNGPQSGDRSSPPALPPGNQLNLQPVPQVVVTKLPDGTTRIVAQQGDSTITILIPYPISTRTWLLSIPFQSAVTISKDVVQNIQGLSAPMLGNPSTLIMRH